VLRRLATRARVRGIGRVRRPVDVVLADGHADLPGRRPLVAHLHEAGWFNEELRSTFYPEFYTHIAERTETAVRAAGRLITSSAAGARDIAFVYGVDPARIHVVPYGVDESFHPGVLGGRSLVSGGRGDEGPPYVLFAAAIHPRKNLAALREAMSALVSEGFPHVLVVAGGPATDRPDSSDLEREARAPLAGAPGRVVRLSAPSDGELAALMAGADAFCLPSLYEGFGLTALEAMACGAPVIVSDRGALPEVVGEAGLICEPTSGAIEAALRRVLTDRRLRQELRTAGPERARAFSWDRTAQGWLEVIKTVAGEG